MSKIYIKKYQNAGTINWDVISQLLSQFSQGKNDINTIVNSTNFNKTVLDNSHSIRGIEGMKPIQPNKTQLVSPSIGSGTGLTQEKTLAKQGFNLDKYSNLGKYADMIPKYNTENKTGQIASTSFDVASNVASSIDPTVGTIMKAAGAGYDLLNNITGGDFSVNNKEKGGLATVDNLLSSKWLGLTPLGAVNSISKLKTLGSDTELTKNITAGYLPSDQIEENEFGGISRLFGKKQIKNRVNRVNRVNTENILKGNTVSKAQKDQEMASNNISNVLTKNYQQLQGGFNTKQLRLLSAKQGIKLYNLKNLVVKAQKGVKLPDILSNSEEKTNVIPNGALHARKNNIKLFGNNITHKGIPVIAGDLIDNNGTIELEKGGEVTQHAEIEKEEIIFHKELTNKIELLYKKYKESDDKDILLKVGKLLTYEILENTEDNVGLLNTIE
jgi:hypothetical protein